MCIRQLNLSKARSVLGTALVKVNNEISNKSKIYDYYIQFELSLGELDRCRKLYQSYIEFQPYNHTIWLSFISFELNLFEYERCRQLYELSLKQSKLTQSESVWKSYIQFETDLKLYDNVRSLYNRLLKQTSHIKVYLSYAAFETSHNQYDSANIIFQQADSIYKGKIEFNEQRVLLLHSWCDFAKSYLSEFQLKQIQSKLPTTVTKKKPIFSSHDNETVISYSEYLDYIYPDSITSITNDNNTNSAIKMIQMAKQWKLKQQMQEQQRIEQVKKDLNENEV